MSLISSAEINQMSADQYQQVLRESKLSSNQEQVAMVKRVGNNIKNLSRSQIRKALHTYTHRPTYLAALLPNARRVNLEGQVEGSVSLENSRQAFWQLKNSKTPPRITRRFPKEAMQPPEQQHVTLQQQPASRKESATKEVVE